MTTYGALTDSLLSPDEEELPHVFQRQFSHPQHTGIISQLSSGSATSAFIDDTECMDTIVLEPNESFSSSLAVSNSFSTSHNAIVTESLFFDTNDQLLANESKTNIQHNDATNEKQDINMSQYFMAESSNDSCKIFEISGSTLQLDKLNAEASESVKDIVISVAHDVVTDLPHEIPREIHHSETIAAAFEESRGLGTSFLGSTRNLSKFFIDDINCSDIDGKNFFDSFAANNNVAETESHKTEDSAPTTPLLAPFAIPFTTVAPRSRTTSECTSTSTDPFSASLLASDSDRRHDAWIPSPTVRQALISKALNPGSFFLEPEQMTMPCVMFAEPLGDPVYDMVSRFMGDQEAKKRSVPSADSVSQDERGLEQLIKAECWRSAVDLTCRLLVQCGQGPNRGNQPAILTPFCLQIWFLRLAMFVKLKMFQQAETELIAFRNLDQADLYYEYYPDLYPGRKGSMVPFGMRLLYAELPHLLGKSQDCLDKLCYLRAIIQRIIANLNEGLSEDGSPVELSTQSQNASLKLWKRRELQCLNSFGNCLIAVKDYSSAMKTFEHLLERDDVDKAAVQSLIGRIYMQVGDTVNASKHFELAANQTNATTSIQFECRTIMNKAFQSLSLSDYDKAYTLFKEVFTKNPTHIAALNNMAVCALYSGRLKEAISLLENLVYKEPDRYLQDTVIINLSTLYELESSRAQHRKQNLLALAAKHKGNGFNIACLKMT